MRNLANVRFSIIYHLCSFGMPESFMNMSLMRPAYHREVRGPRSASSEGPVLLMPSALRAIDLDLLHEAS